ncbi:MAG TPA: hypothetical protein PLD20_30410, partial [Blastocatellia bacterium]|nr:hypothetical protein [Blastocatellia bacterium]
MPRNLEGLRTQATKKIFQPAPILRRFTHYRMKAKVGSKFGDAAVAGSFTKVRAYGGETVSFAGCL